MAQLDALLTQEADESRLHNFTTTYTNLTHIVAHAEGNARFLQDDAGLEEIRSFLGSDSFDARACHWIDSVGNCSPHGERTRAEWLTFFQTQPSKRSNEVVHQEGRLALALANVLRASAVDVTALLGRLGIGHEPGRHDAAFFAIASRVEDSATREKLNQAWVTTKSKRNDDIVTAVQLLVEARFRQAQQTQFQTPMTRALANATISSDALARFLGDYLAEAIGLARDLSEMVGSVVRFPTGWAVDFPRYLNVTENADLPLLLPLDGCIGLLAQIAARSFGLTLEATESPLAEGRCNPFLVTRDGTPLGIVVFHQTVEAKTERLDLDYASLARSGLPVGHVLCRMASNDLRCMTFDATRVLFHEFGHALVHILVRDRKPGTTGLDYLPVERLEFLSTWFEHWVYHQALDDIVIPSERAPAALGRARRVKAFEFMKSNLTRAVCAVLDFQIHSDPCASVREVMRQLRKRHSEIDQIIESELLADFAHPLLLAHPGCSFVYPLASSYALERFLPLMKHPAQEIDPDLCSLELCIEPGGICHMPDATAPRVFVGAMIRSVPHTLQ